MEKLQEEESLAIYFCGRSNLEAGRSFVDAFEQLSERAASQQLSKQLEALKVVLEAIGGLWLGSVPDGVFLPLVCKFQLRGSRVHALSVEDIDLGTVYSSIKWCEFPLALLLLYGDDLAYTNECRISNSKLPKISKEDQDAAQLICKSFRVALADLGGTEQEILEIFANIALILHTDTEDVNAEHQNETPDPLLEKVRELNYDVLNKVLRLLHKAFRPNSRIKESRCTNFSKPKEIALYTVPITECTDGSEFSIEDFAINFCSANTKIAQKATKIRSRDSRKFYHNLLADMMLLIAHKSDLSLVYHKEEHRLKNNTCVVNALDPKKEIVLEEIFEDFKVAGSTSYTHYLRECNYTISAQENFKLDILKKAFKSTTHSSPVIFVHGQSEKWRLQSIFSYSAEPTETQRDATILCTMLNCSFCSSFEETSKCIIKVANDTLQACKAKMDQSRKNEFNKDISNCLKSSSKIAMDYLSNYNVDLESSFMFKHTLMPCLIKQWQIEVRMKLKRLDTLELYYLQQNLEKCKRGDPQSILEYFQDVQSSNLLKPFEGFLFSFQRHAITEFVKRKVEKYFNALAPKVNMEMEFIQHFKTFLTLEQTPTANDLRDLKLVEFAKGNADFEHLKQSLEANQQRFSNSKCFQKLNNTNIKKFHLLPLLKKSIDDFCKSIEFVECIETRTIEIKGMALELRQLLPGLKQKLSTSYRNVRIMAEEILHIDCSLDGPEWSGVNLYLRTNFLRVHRTQIIDVSGREIAFDTSTTTANTVDGRGDDGTNGLNGSEGGDIIIDALHVENGEGLTLMANGGNGQPGQNGGNGKDGMDGVGLDPATFKKQFDSSFKTKCKPRFHIKKLDIVKKDECYIEAKEKTSGLRMIYNYEGIHFNEYSLFVCFGTQGTIGGPGGCGGQGGIGGHAGTVIAPCSKIKAQNKRGADGAAGKAGSSGIPGRNGWDIGCTDGRYRQARYYGLGKNMKLRLVQHAKEAPYRVYCSYFKSFIEICAEGAQTAIENCIISSQQLHQANSTEVADRDHLSYTRLLCRKHKLKNEKLYSQPLTERQILLKARGTSVLNDQLLKAMEHHYINSSKLFFLHGTTDCISKNLLHKRFTESALKFLILANTDLKHGNVNKSTATMQKVWKFKCACIGADKEILLETYSKSSQSGLIQSYINILSSGYFSNYPFLHVLAERIYFSQEALDSQELIFVLDFIINSFGTDMAEIVLVLWCLSVHPMAMWVKELTALNLQSIFKDDVMVTLLCDIRHTDAIILLNDQLRADDASSELMDRKRTVEIILKRLSKQPNELPKELSQLQLQDWHKILKLSFLRAILSDKDIHDDKAVCNMLKVEQNFGSEKAARIFGIITQTREKKKGGIQNEQLQNILDCEFNKSMDNLRDVFQSIKLCTIPGFDQIRRECDLAKEGPVNSGPKEISKALENIRKTGYTTKEYIHLIALIESQIQKVIADFALRPTQKVAVLLLLLSDRRTILQVGTGEGKSLIIAIVAITRALLGKKVHIITSSHVLAQRDSEDKTLNMIYKLFEIAISNNCHDNVSVRRKRYTKSAVTYGSVSSFQRDFLLHTFYKENLDMDPASFNNRTCIIDEVDSMLLDKGNNSLYLSHEIAGFEKLDSVFEFIWKRVSHYKIYTKVMKLEMKKKVWRELWSELRGVITEKDIKLLDSSLNPKEAKRILMSLKVLQLIDQNGMLLLGSVSEGLSNILHHHFYKKDARFVKFIPKLIYLLRQRLDKSSSVIQIPKFLYTFVEENLDQWIESAMAAIQLSEKRDYVLENSTWPRIVMIDRDTGTDLRNAEWDEALHQFLQIKHGLPPTTVKLKAVFISNTTYLKKYSTLVGLTGTLGSTQERNLLQEIYDADFAILPNNKPKNFTLLEPKILNDKNAWCLEIKMEIKRVFEEKRAILIVCSTVEDVEFLNKEIKGDSFLSVFTYLRESDNFDFESADLTKETIIIATNLAGRGTDIKLSPALNDSGGLHVCVAYMPPNDRVEEQALGRAARHGAPGSGRVICYVNDSHASSYHSLVVDRAGEEIKRLADIKRFYETQVHLEEECLQLFHKTYLKFEYDTRKYFQDITITSEKRDENGAVIDQFVKEILQRFLDQWAMWIDSTKKHLVDDRSSISKADMLQRLETYLKKVTDNGWKNMLQYNTIANIKLIKLFARHGFIDLAFDLCDSVAEHEPNFSGFARYYLAFGALNKVKEENLHKIAKHLQVAKSLFENEIQYIELKILNSDHATKLTRSGAFVTRQLLASKKVYEAFLESTEHLLGKKVDFEYFFAQIRDDVDHIELLEEIETSLHKENVLKSATVTENFDISVINKLSFERAIPLDSLRSALVKWSTGGESKLIEIFDNDLKMPSKELFWKQLTEAFVEEYDLVMVSLANLQATECEIFESITQSLESEELKPFDVANLSQQIGAQNFALHFSSWTALPSSDYLLLYEPQLRIKVYGKAYARLLKLDILTHHKIAIVNAQKFSNLALSSFDSLNMKLFARLSIVETTDIISALEANSILKREGDELKLKVPYSSIDELDLNQFQIYSTSIKEILELSFVFRGAHQNILQNAKNDNSVICPSLPEQMGAQLLHALVESCQVQPQKVSKVPSETDLIKLASKIFDGDTVSSASETSKHVGRGLLSYLKSCESALSKNAELCSKRINDEHDFEITQFSLIGADEIISEKSVNISLWRSHRLINSHLLLAIGKALYVTDTVLQILVDGKIQEAHNELFHIKIPVLNQMFDKNAKRVIETLMQAANYSLKTFQPHVYSCIKTGSKHLRPQLKRALELLAKTYLKNSSVLKSEQLMLLQFGLHEDRLRTKLNICELTFKHKIVFNAFEPVFKSHFTSTFHTFVEDCIEQLRKVDPAKMSSLKFNEQLQNTIVEKIRPFLDKCLQSIQMSIKQNFLAQREWNFRDSPDAVNQLLEWHGEADFQWAARDLISQLFISTNSESKGKILPDADYLKKQEATFKKRLVAEVTNRVTSPLYKECCQTLAAVLRKEILESNVNNDTFVNNEAAFEGEEFVNRERMVFETSVRKLLHMTRDPTILAHAIQEEVPLRTELVVKLLPSLQRFLECKSLVVAIRHKDEEQIPGTLTIFLDIKDKEFATVVGGIASIFSEIKMQTDWDLSESAFKHELANYFTNSEELEKVRIDLGDIKQSPEAIAISEITPLERFESELVKYIDVAIQILNGESNNPQSSSGRNATPGSESCVVAGVKLLPTIFEKESLLKKAFQVRSHKVASWN